MIRCLQCGRPFDNAEDRPVASISGNAASGGTGGFAGSGLKGIGDLTKTDPKTDPKLGSLKNNGGVAFTHALLPDSPAIDCRAVRQDPRIAIVH